MKPVALSRVGAILLALSPLFAASDAFAGSVGGFPLTAPPAPLGTGGFPAPTAPGSVDTGPSQFGGFPSAPPTTSGSAGGFPTAPPADPGQSQFGGFPSPPPMTAGGSGGFPMPAGGTMQTGAPPPVANGQPQWFVSQSGSLGTAGSIVTLTFGVPETDDLGFVATCEPGSAGGSIPLSLYIDIGRFGVGQQVPLSLGNGVVGGSYSGTVTTGESDGVSLSLDPADPLWTMLESGGQFVASVPGGQPASMPLDGAAPQVQSFLSACATQFAAAGSFGAPMAQPGAPSMPMGPQAPMAPQMPMAPPSSGGSQAMGPAPAPDFLTPTVFQLGKWVEGLSYDGQWLWAAESGQRTIARVDPNTGKLMSRISVGRLPVAMASAADGTTYALVETDKVLWRQPSRGKGGVFARLRSCPQDMTLAGDTPWVLVLPDCSSGRSQLVRIDPMNGQQTASPELGEWGQALTPVGSQIWVAHVRGDAAISVTEQGTMRTNWINARGASLWSITANSRFVYGGGRIGDANDQGLIVMFDQDQQIPIRRAAVPERVVQIDCDDQHVIAVGEKGTIWVLSANDLTIERTIVLTTGPFDPKAIAIEGNTLFLTAGTYHGDSGAILVVDNVVP